MIHLLVSEIQKEINQTQNKSSIERISGKTTWFTDDQLTKALEVLEILDALKVLEALMVLKVLEVVEVHEAG